MTIAAKQMHPQVAVFAYVNILALKVKDMYISLACFPKSHPFPLVAVFLFLACNRCLATEVVIIVNHHRIVIGADSKVSQGDRSFCKCKIRQMGDVFWSAVGIDFDPKTMFSLDSAFGEFKDSHLSAGKLLDAVGKRIRPRLQEELPALKASDPERYSRMVSAKAFMYLYAITNRRGKLDAFSKEFGLVDEIAIPRPAKLWIPEGVLDSDGSQVPYINSHSDEWTGDDIKALSFIDELIQMGVDSDPAVGPPFSVLVLRASSAKWLRQNDCADIQGNHAKGQNPTPLHKK
jgi:hypothetical protein